MFTDEDLARLLERKEWSLPYGHLSPSQVWSYIACGACYEAEHVLKIPRPTSADLLIGRFTHVAVARLRDRIVEDALDSERVSAGDLPDAEYIAAGDDEFEGILHEQRIEEETGEVIPIEVELTRKFADLGEAKDAAVRVTRVALPMIAKYDLKAGIEAHEQRVWHLGPAPNPENARSDEDASDFSAEATEQAEYGITPVFPFPVKAYLDVMYANGVKKDLKTAGRMGPPDLLACLQLLIYDLPWWAAGEPQMLGWDVAVKTKTPGFASYWYRSLEEALPDGRAHDRDYRYALWRVLRVAEDISAGRFVPNDASLFCRFEHGLQRGVAAATIPGLEAA